jgi:MFS transporter, UMF1 family
MFKFTKKEWSYILYDWAESAFTVVFATFIFPGLYTSLSTTGGGNLTNDQSSILYQVIISGISILIAISSPILGTLSDYRGTKNRFFKLFFYVGILSSALIPLYPYFPWWVVLIPFAISYLAYSATNVFYDSFIVDVTTDERMDRVSTTAYAFGYLGGSTIPLVIGIALLSLLEDTTLALQITFLVTTLWWALFSIPFLRHVKQVHGIEPEKNPVKQSFARLFSTLKEAKKYRKVFLFLIAFFLYIDGVHTIISQAVPFAVNAIPSVTSDNVNNVLLPIFLMIQIAAFVFAIIFSLLAKKYKTESLLLVTIGIYAFISLFSFFINEVWMFTILGLMVATAQGAVQSLSRSYFGKIVPKDKANEFFGLYTIFSRVAAFMGPAVIAIVSSLVLVINGTDQIESETFPGAMRYGILALIVLFFLGGILFNKARKIPTDYLDR